MVEKKVLRNSTSVSVEIKPPIPLSSRVFFPSLVYFCLYCSSTTCGPQWPPVTSSLAGHLLSFALLPGIFSADKLLNFLGHPLIHCLKSFPLELIAPKVYFIFGRGKESTTWPFHCAWRYLLLLSFHNLFQQSKSTDQLSTVTLST